MARSVGSSRGLNQIKRCGGRPKAGGSWQRHEESTEPEDVHNDGRIGHTNTFSRRLA